MMEPDRQSASETFNKNRRRNAVKLIAIIIWGLVLCLNTWTESLEKFIDFQSIGFQWDPSPNFLEFFNFYDLTLIHRNFVIVKLGHFMGFAVMDVLIYSLLKSHRRSVAISIIFALFTEVLQLFFGRDGRFYDLCIDSLGVLSVYAVIRIFSKKVRR